MNSTGEDPPSLARTHPDGEETAAQRSAVDQPERDTAGVGSRWRFAALPLVPFVLAWDAARAALRAWAEFGTRLLGKLDPLFAGLYPLWVRIGERLRPLVEPVGAFLRHVGQAVAPTLARLARILGAILARIGHITAAVTRLAAPVAAAARRTLRGAASLLRPLWQGVRRATQPVRRLATRTLNAARQAVRSVLYQLRSD